jgi:hypothetical protein
MALSSVVTRKRLKSIEKKISKFEVKNDIINVIYLYAVCSAVFGQTSGACFTGHLEQNMCVVRFDIVIELINRPPSVN